MKLYQLIVAKEKENKLRKMAPAAALPRAQPNEADENGINAILLGPPGSGKGTQVYCLNGYYIEPKI